MSRPRRLVLTEEAAGAERPAPVLVGLDVRARADALGTSCRSDRALVQASPPVELEPAVPARLFGTESEAVGATRRPVTAPLANVHMASLPPWRMSVK